MRVGFGRRECLGPFDEKDQVVAMHLFKLSDVDNSWRTTQCYELFSGLATCQVYFDASEAFTNHAGSERR
jgi:hypothetical protein